MPEKIRCSNCGALNPADAEWCNQCLTVFRQPEPEPEPEVEPEPAAVIAPAASDVTLSTDPDASAPAMPQPAVPQPATSTSIPASAAGTHGAFTVTESGITWTCSVCETVNPLDASVCTVCESPFAETIREKPERIQRDPNMAAMLSLFLPGAGHAYLGMWGQAVARAIVSLWALLVVSIAALSKGQAGARVIGLTFGLVAVGLWVIAAHDAYREARYEPSQVLLKGRVFLYLVLALLTLLMAMLMATGLSQS